LHWVFEIAGKWQAWGVLVFWFCWAFCGTVEVVLCVTGLVNGLQEYRETDSKAVSGVSGSVCKGEEDHWVIEAYKRWWGCKGWLQTVGNGLWYYLQG